MNVIKCQTKSTYTTELKKTYKSIKNEIRLPKKHVLCHASIFTTPPLRRKCHRTSILKNIYENKDQKCQRMISYNDKNKENTFFVTQIKSENQDTPNYASHNASNNNNEQRIDISNYQNMIFEPSDKTENFGSNVPWGKAKIIEVMVLWFISFCLFRSSIWKIGSALLEITSECELSAIGQAIFTLSLDLSMLCSTIFILNSSLRKFRPLRKIGLFPTNFKGNKWLIILAISSLAIPFIDWMGTSIMDWFPEVVDRHTSNVVVQLSRQNIVPNILYFILLSVCAPIWEELMFRGFLLPSLGKFLPIPLSILFSSTIFAMMHGNIRQFLPLCLLGIIIGNAFVKSKNIMTPILLHSFYNCYVFLHVLLG